MKKFFTLKELLDAGLPELPTSIRGLSKYADRNGWKSNESKARKIKRIGGGFEFHISLLPAAAQSKLGMLFSNNQDEKQSDLWATYNALTLSQKETCEDRLKAVQFYFEAVSNGFNKSTSADMTAVEFETSKRTIQNWVKTLSGVDQADWLAALAPQYRSTSERIDCHAEAYKVLKSDYLRSSKSSFSACYRRTKELAEKNGWEPIPSERVMRRHLNQDVPVAVQTLTREGKDLTKTLYPAQRRTRDHMHAMQAVNMDGHKFDVFVKTPDRQKPFRAMLIALQDLYSGKFVAWRLAESENKVTVRLTIGDMVTNFGIPESIYLDNGRAFASKWITGGVKNRFRYKVRDEDPKGLLTTLGVNIHWTTPYSGQSKPIERAFRDLADNIAKHPLCAGAYTGNKPDAQPDDYGTRAIDWKEFASHVDQQIHEHNARVGRKGQGLHGRSCDQAFKESMESPSTIVRQTTEDQRALWLMAAEQVSCKRGSGEIHLHGNRYWSQELNAHAGTKVVVRFDPDNLNLPVSVYDLEDRLICEAPLFRDAKFDDVDAARTHNRKRKDMMRTTRELQRLHAELKPDQLADIYSDIEKTEKPENPRPAIPRIVPTKRVVNGPDVEWQEQDFEHLSKGLEQLDNNIFDFNKFVQKDDE